MTLSLEFLAFILLVFLVTQTMGNAYYYHTRHGFSDVATWIALFAPLSLSVVLFLTIMSTP